MLSERERRALEEIERSLADDGPPLISRPARWAVVVRHWRWVWVQAFVLGSVCVFLMLEGAASGGLALVVAGTAGWLLWRFWPVLREQGATALPAGDGDGGTGKGSGPSRSALRARPRSIPGRSAES